MADTPYRVRLWEWLIEPRISILALAITVSILDVARHWVTWL